MLRYIRYITISCYVNATGLIHEGDKLKEVNGVPLEDKNPEEIIPILVCIDGHQHMVCLDTGSPHGMLVCWCPHQVS